MTRLHRALALAALLAASPAFGQTGPSPAALEDAARLGAVATLAPLCGLRQENWAFDLRRAMILQATRSARPDDSALRAAPGRAQVESALGFADTEALEEFAGQPPERTCGPLASNPELARADAIVQSFRALRDGKPAS